MKRIKPIQFCWKVLNQNSKIHDYELFKYYKDNNGTVYNSPSYFEKNNPAPGCNIVERLVKQNKIDFLIY